MASKKPIRIMLAASACVIANVDVIPAKANLSDQNIEPPQAQWNAITKAFANGELSILGSGTGRPGRGVLAQSAFGNRSPASPFGN